MKKLAVTLSLALAASAALASAVAFSIEAYRVPEAPVIRQDGKRVMLPVLLNDGRPVLLNFIFTSCNAICPVTSQVFMGVREQLGDRRDAINMVSISIDPEEDTPRSLAKYAGKYGTYGTWTHVTSTASDSMAIQRAFDAWRGDKMNHMPTTYIRCAPNKPWLRFDGFATPQDLVKGLACPT
jgi:protein SCO1/2